MRTSLPAAAADDDDENDDDDGDDDAVAMSLSSFACRCFT